MNLAILMDFPVPKSSRNSRAKNARPRKKVFLIMEHLPQPQKAGDIVAWLKQDFELGHGHAMAIYALLKGKKE
ncbi:MAG: DUF4287 domain-containing protein [Bacteroidales bacterium]|nr:DUF4287 domain-containing protein [Bacteroidales bacterium]